MNALPDTANSLPKIGPILSGPVDRLSSAPKQPTANDDEDVRINPT